MDIRTAAEAIADADLSPIARCIALLEAGGITDAKELQRLTNSSERTVRRARSELAAAKNGRTEMAAPAKNDRNTGQNCPETAKNDRPELAASRARKESPSGIVIPIEDSPPTPSRPEIEASESEVIVNGTAIKGPWFKLEYAAIDMAAELAAMPSKRARQIAELCARDWVANDIHPQNPMAMVRAAINADKNQTAIQEVRLSRASNAPGGKAAAPLVVPRKEFDPYSDEAQAYAARFAQ
jgi:hypothetical protein